MTASIEQMPEMTAPDVLVAEGVRDETTSRPVRVMIVDDHPVYVGGLQSILEAGKTYRVVGTAASSDAARAMAHQVAPDLVLLDIELPNASGFDLISPITRTCPDCKIVVLTGYSGDSSHALTAVRLGAHGFLQKDMRGSQIVAALDMVMRGERVIGKPQTLTAVLEECSQLMRDNDRERRGITEQEVEIIRLAAAGLNNKAIGAHQFFSEITVKRKMKDIYGKLGVKSRAQAVAEAIRLGYL